MKTFLTLGVVVLGLSLAACGRQPTLGIHVTETACNGTECTSFMITDTEHLLDGVCTGKYGTDADCSVPIEYQPEGGKTIKGVLTGVNYGTFGSIRWDGAHKASDIPQTGKLFLKK